jgi:YihY family inner membrane protein
MDRKESIIKRLGKAFIRATRAMLNHEIPRDAAAISYFSLIALFPSLLVLISLTDAVLGWVDLHKKVVQTIIALFPGSRQFLRAYLSELTTPSTALTVSCLIVILWSSTWIFIFIENALNRAWGVPRRRTFWQSRLRSTVLMALGGICLLISAGITTVVTRLQTRSLAGIWEFIEDPIIHRLWSFVFFAAGLLVAVLVFWLIFKLMPDRKVPWMEALSGAVVSATMWEIASYVFVRIVPSFDYQKIYGKTGTFIFVLIWIYTSNFIMLFGANFSAQLDRSGLKSEMVPIPAESDRDNYRNKIRSFPKTR